jgi:hypothetical protein
MWKVLPVDRIGSLPKKGIITDDIKDVSVTTAPEGYSTLATSFIKKQDIKVYMKAISGNSTNNVVMDYKVSNYSMGHNIRLVYEGKQVGFICGLPHRIIYTQDMATSLEVKEVPKAVEVLVDKSFKFATSSVTTYLSVNKENRSKDVIQHLINSLMLDGFSSGVTSGYFYGSKPHTLSAIAIPTWYRVLDVSKAQLCKYAVVLPKSFKELGDGNQLESARMFYKVKQLVKPRKLKYIDFSRVVKRDVSFLPTEADFERLTQEPFEWAVYENAEGGIITCTTKYKILQPTGKTITSSLLVYCEVLDSEFTESSEFKVYLDSLFSTIKTQGSSAVHGIAVGPLAYQSKDFFGPILGTSTGVTFLDFYNFKTGRERNPCNINLLYI